MSAELFISLHVQLSYLFMVSSATRLWVCGLPIECQRPEDTLVVELAHHQLIRSDPLDDFTQILCGLLGHLEVSGEEK